MTSPPVHPGLKQRVAVLRHRSVHDPHNPDVREVVRLRANDAYEYCLLPTFGTFEIEHIIPRACRRITPLIASLGSVSGVSTAVLNTSTNTPGCVPLVTGPKASGFPTAWGSM